jgi:FkbM family methyltransferase
VYSVGVGDDVTWDLALIDRFGVRVDAFDPTPRSIRWVQSRPLPAGFIFHALGLAEFDGEAQFAKKNKYPDGCSYDLVRSGTEASDAVEKVIAPVARLGTIMNRLGHDRLDVLKMDIEGAEYEVLADMLLARIYPKQLLVEFHYFEGAAQRIDQTTRLIHRLNEEGYRAFARSPNGYEFSFVRD